MSFIFGNTQASLDNPCDGGMPKWFAIGVSTLEKRKVPLSRTVKDCQGEARKKRKEKFLELAFISQGVQSRIMSRISVAHLVAVVIEFEGIRASLKQK